MVDKKTLEEAVKQELIVRRVSGQGSSIEWLLGVIGHYEGFADVTHNDVYNALRRLTRSFVVMSTGKGPNCRYYISLEDYRLSRLEQRDSSIVLSQANWGGYTHDQIRSLVFAALVLCHLSHRSATVSRVRWIIRGLEKKKCLPPASWLPFAIKHLREEGAVVTEEGQSYQLTERGIFAAVTMVLKSP